MVPAKCSNQMAAKVVSASALLTLLLISIAALGVALGYEWARVSRKPYFDTGCLQPVYSCRWTWCRTTTARAAARTRLASRVAVQVNFQYSCILSLSTWETKRRR